MKKKPSLLMQTILLTLSIVVLSASFYLQYAKGLEPCPLCLMQRICVMLLLVSTFFYFYLKPIPWKKLIWGQGIITFLGLYFALRQLWLLSLPGHAVPACLPGLSVLFHYFPWQDTLHALLWGTGDCTEIRATWLGLSLPAWSTLYFLGTGFLILLTFFSLGKGSKSHQ
jgi:disulfide bond formation protein DsbB